MNLSVVEKMVADGDVSGDALRYLVSCQGECEWLDFKRSLNLDSDAQCADFTRDVIAMKNVGGGYIVAGVEDKTWRPLGIPARLPQDTKMLRDVIRKCSGLEIDVDIVHHRAFIDVGTGLFALILVRGSHKRKKRRAPSVAVKDFHPAKSFGIRRGEIFVRSGDSTTRLQSQQQLEDVLDRLESLADQDALEATRAPVPFAVFDGTYRLLEKGYDVYVGRQELRESLLSSVTKDPRVWIIDVHGPGGVGKSALVNWAVYEFYRHRKFEAILHLSAKETRLTAQGIQPSARSLYSLENLLDHVCDLFQEKPPAELNDKRNLAVSLLDAWSTLLVLDNMETVSDARILKFAQDLPPTTKAKVILTSRHKTGGWELPIPVSELKGNEVRDFIRTKSAEMELRFPEEDRVFEQVESVTGGLPLALQWLLARFKITHNLTQVLRAVGDKDSPILEFSFRNIWNLLSQDAKAMLGVLTIFDAPPDSQQIAISTGWSSERIDSALSELSEATLVTPAPQFATGKLLYVCLPITQSFARHQLQAMGDFEVSCRRRLQKFKAEMELQDWEVRSFAGTFDQYGLVTQNDKRAAILCSTSSTPARTATTISARCF